MKVDFEKGYIVYKKGKNTDLVIVAPHSGPALETTLSQDSNSETVASLLWKKIGGTLVISNMPRKRMWGVDFNRDIPTKKLALKHFKDFDKKEYGTSLVNYRKKYGWVAVDEDDYDNRYEIYKNFWGEVRKGKFIIMIHRAFPRLKAYPSIMDIVTFKNKGVNRKKLSRVVKKVNDKYYGFFKKVEKDYKEMVMFEEKRFCNELMDIFHKFDYKHIEKGYGDHLRKDVDKIRKHADKKVVNKLKKSFTPRNFIEGAESALKNMGIPEVTIEDVFTGDLAHGPKKELFPNKGKIILEIEGSRFINFWHPHIARDIIIDVIKGLKKS